jgi:lipoprotein signal peptidase
MRQPNYRLLFWTLALLGLAFDQGSKYLVFWQLYNDGRGGAHEIMPGFDGFRLETTFTGQTDPGDHPLTPLRTWGGDAMPYVNNGALFGAKFWLSPEQSNRVFAVVSLLAAVAIMYWSTHRTLAQDWVLCTALGLILGGTLGNLYDRVVFHGVRDFLHWNYAFDWPVFNIADCCLVCGAFLLLFQAFFTKHEHAAERTEQTLTQSAA